MINLLKVYKFLFKCMITLYNSKLLFRIIHKKLKKLILV